jgi:hypothetical protein
VCGGLPLALQITAALLKADPALSAAELAGELSGDRLAALRYDDGSGQGAPSVAAAFELSYHRLDETSARVFRLLPVHPGPDVSTVAAAVLADLPTGQVRRVLAGLAAAHLAEAAAGPGDGGGCMTCCACMPRGCLRSTRTLKGGSRRGTGCSAGTCACKRR